MGKKIKVIGLVAVLMIGELVAAYFIFGHSGGNAAHAEGDAAAEAHKKEEEEHAAEEHEEHQAGLEVELGEFNVIKSQPLASTTLRISFKMYGMVGAKDEATFKELFEEKKHRFREQVLEIVRSSDVNDLNDPVLGLIKRKILEKSNRLIGKPLLTGVVFSDFAYIEQ